MSSSINTGDLIFVRPTPSKYSPLDDAILATGKATLNWMSMNNYDNVDITQPISSHVAMAWRHDTTDELYFVQALPGDGVILTNEDDFFHSSIPEFTTYYIAKPIAELQEYSSIAAKIALEQIGKPYADDFQAPPDFFYCSSLVDWAYQQATKKDEMFAPKDFTLIFAPEQWWEKYYASMTPPQDLPSNVTGSNPTLVMHSQNLIFKEYIH